MTTRETALTRVLECWDGSITAPARLANVTALDDRRADGFLERLLTATREDLGDVTDALANLSALKPNMLSRLAARLGWTVKVLADWNPASDKSGLLLEAALASAAAWDDGHGNFWKAVRSRLSNCRVTMAGFEIVLRSREAQATVPEDTPIWEREHLQALQAAEKAADWAQLSERANAFQQLPRVDVSARQATLALALLDWPRLVRVADRVESWLQGHMLLAPLSISDAFRLATSTKSDHLRFAALERVARREVRDLSPEEETALRNLLIVLSKDENSWPRWLSVCNRYPIRHPHIQTSLGRALAFCAPHALQAYVDSIPLTTSDTDMRACVTRCLSVFRTHAKEGRRRLLWRQAFDRWQVWDFAIGEDHKLIEIARSALDFAVVGWLVEGFPQRSAEDLELAFERGLRSLDSQWHASSPSATSGFFRLLSKHQVMGHALHSLEENSEWLPGPLIFEPRAADKFVRRQYRWRNAMQPGSPL